MKEWLGLPPDASAHGPEIDVMLLVIHWMMFILFVGWGAFFVYTLFRFRSRKNPKANYVGVRSHFSNYVEVGVAVFEVILLVAFAIPLWAKRVNAFPPDRDALMLHVVAEQFAWNIHYPGPDGIFGMRAINLISEDNPLGLDRSDPNAKDDITTINQLNLPVNKPVIIQLTSKDVVHSFSLPMLRVKQDVIPGQQIPVWFTAVMTSEQVRESMKKQYAIADTAKIPAEVFESDVAARQYTAKDSAILLNKGDYITKEVISQLLAAGITEISVEPSANPTEIACAQLCGLGHYRMRGYVNIQSPEDFDKWIKEQEAMLSPSPDTTSTSSN